jgi:hypothetical protein
MKPGEEIYHGPDPIEQFGTPFHVTDYKTVYVDIDETLAMADLSEFPDQLQVEVFYSRSPMFVVPNEKNINLLIKFWKLGYEVIFWSKTGGDWARAVAEAFDLTYLSKLYLTKPLFYIDDQPCENWMGTRCYRDADSGKESA